MALASGLAVPCTCSWVCIVSPYRNTAFATEAVHIASFTLEGTYS